MKFIVYIFTVFLIVNLVGCKSDEQVAEECQKVMQGLDQCVAHRAKGLSCSTAVDLMAEQLDKTTMNDFNRSGWQRDCRSLCSNTDEYQSIVRNNYAAKCFRVEKFTVKDERFIKLAVLAGMWLVGVIVLLFGVRSVKRIFQFKNSGIKTKGLVLRHESRRSDGSTVYAPVIEFKDWMGREHKFTAKIFTSSMNEPSEEVGNTVNVIYPKDNPDQVRYDTFISLWLLPLFLLVWGGSFTIISSIGLFSSKDWRQHHAYLQQHAPVIAKKSDIFATTLRESVPVLTKISGYRIIEERPGYIVIEADYRLSPFQEGKFFMGAITLMDGRSSGKWGYRPARLQKGFGTAQVRLGASSKHCSNQIKLSIYRGGKGKIYQRVIPYEKCWEKAGK